MAKFSFFNMPAWGHVNPTLAVVQELVRRGQEVHYYLTEEFRSTIEATGAIFHPFASKLQDLSIGGFGSNGANHAFAKMLEDREFVPPQIRDQLFANPPDIVIYDFMCFWAKDLIAELGVPAIATRATYASNEHFSLMDNVRTQALDMPGMEQFMERIKRLNADPSSAQALFFFSQFRDSEQLNIVFMPRIYQPMAETFDERYVFVGASILSRYQKTDFPFERLDPSRPLLYISMGSIATNQPEFYRYCFAAFGDQPWQVVLSIGSHVDIQTLGPIPENFILSSYVPQLEILPRTTIFVTHAGTNSIMESLASGVPMVLIPQQPEQFMHAKRSVELGVGVQLNKETVTSTTLKEAVEQIAGSDIYRQHALELQRHIQEAGGYQRAADVILQFTESQLNQVKVV